MSELQRVLNWFQEGKLVRPRAGQQCTIVDLISAIACVCGAPARDPGVNVRRLVQQIGNHEHVVFVLIDGLGLQLLRDLAPGEDSFLRQHLVRELQAVYPSTTAVALTSLGTGVYPAQHGISGWWMYLEELDISVEILPFVERFSKRNLHEFGLLNEQVFISPSVLPGFRHSPLIVTRNYISDSTYSRYWSGGCRSIGYERIAESIDLVIRHVQETPAPSYTHLYLPQLDGACHHHGVDHEAIHKLFKLLDDEMRRLHAAIGTRARLVISADHGHINPTIDRHLHHSEPLAELLRCPPTGDQTVPLFHVKEGRHEEFRDGFARQFGDLFALLSIDEVEQLQLLGPGKMTPAARRHFGDYLGIAPGAHTLHYMHPILKTNIHKGVHSGMTPAEMTVPLILV
ncbi:MAG TPA: alkaline phosphatase family protein [Planctomycetota bacterium]|nr:alkaline phosphatase family protein [Planctomycetota bacterium]